MIDISDLPAEKKVFVTDSLSPGQNRALRGEQKSIACMRDVIWKFTKARQLVVDP